MPVNILKDIISMTVVTGEDRFRSRSSQLKVRSQLMGGRQSPKSGNVFNE